MARRIDVVLDEIIQTITEIENAANGSSFQSFMDDWLLQRGIERALEIISEAVRHIPEAMLAEREDIPWSDIKAIGNFIRHEYHRVDPAMIWSVIADDLSSLKNAIFDLRSQLDK